MSEDSDVVGGGQPPSLVDVRPQERVQWHTMEHIVDFVCRAPLVQTLCAAVPQTMEQLQDVLRFFDRLTTVPEQVIEVPKILPEDVPLRAVLRATQLAEQLVEVPTIISNPLLLLLQALLEHKQRTVEQNVDIQAVGDRGTGGSLFGFLPGQNYSMTAIRFLGQVALKIFKVYPVDRVQQRFRSRSPSFPIQVEVVKIFTQSRPPQRLPRILLDKLVKGFFALFTTGKKVRISRAPRGRNWVPSRAHGRCEFSWGLFGGTTWGAASSLCC